MADEPDGLGQHLVFDADGVPEAVLDMDRITDAGTLLAFGLTAGCQDPVIVDRIICEARGIFGDLEFAYVASSALSVLARHPLAEAVAIVRATTGRDMVAEARVNFEGWKRPD